MRFLKSKLNCITFAQQRHPNQRGAGPRSIPPPAHEAQHYSRGGDGRGGGGGGGGRHGGSRSHHQQHPHDWDRHQGGHSIVPLPTGGSHSSRNSAANQARRSDGRGPRSTSSGRPQAIAGGSGAASGAARSHGGYGAEQAIPGSIGGGVQAAISSGGVVARAQLPLPLPPPNGQQQMQQQQQLQLQQPAISPQQQPQQAFYTPKGVCPISPQVER